MDVFHCDNITKGFDAEFSLFRAVMRARTKAPGIRGSMDPYHFFGLWQQASNTPGACRRGLSSTPEFPLRKEPAVNRNSKIVASRTIVGGITTGGSQFIICQHILIMFVALTGDPRTRIGIGTCATNVSSSSNKTRHDPCYDMLLGGTGMLC